MQRIVLTGGPGAGKTSVLLDLRARGYTVGEDAARTIIKARQTAGLSPRPDAAEFARQILTAEQRAYRAAVAPLTFYERGVVDAAGYLYAAGDVSESDMQRLIQAHPYDVVFLFPPWQAIYHTDAERDHTFEHAQNVYDSTQRTYVEAGYVPINVPRLSVTQRTEFILANVE